MVGAPMKSVIEKPWINMKKLDKLLTHHFSISLRDELL